MNLVKVCTLAAILIGISTAIEIFYVLPDNSPNISCPSHHCATFSQYFLDNDTLPVVSNVEYHLLPGEHYMISTEIVLLGYLQNFSLVGLYNKKLQLLSTILVSTDIVIFDSYNVTIKNVIFEMLVGFSSDINVKVQLVLCIYCTVENVTLLGYGLLGYNLIGRSYLNNIAIKLNSEYQCNNQGITLRYDNYSFNESKSDSKCITTTQNVSVYYDSTCHTDRGIIFVDIEEYQTVDSIEIVISNSQFTNVMLRPIIDIKDDSKTTRCMIWIVNCTFESVIDTAIITVTLPQFNTALIFFNCEFHYCSRSDEYLVAIIVALEMNFRNVACTNITFNKCNFSNNNGGLLSFRNAAVWLSYCNLNIMFIGPTYISNNELSTSASLSVNMENMIHIDGMAIYIYGSINISSNTVHINNIMAFQSCEVSINGPITISSNMVLEANVMVLQYCSVLFQGPIIISHNFATDSIISFSACDITFHKQIMFISNTCDKIINIQLQYTGCTYIKVMENATITFLTNKYSNDLIILELNNDHNKPYPFCLFQYMTTKTNTSTIIPEDYTVIFAENTNTLIDFDNLTKCRQTFDRFTSHCKWLPTSVFYGHNPGLINQQIIQIDNRKINYHTFICLLSSQLHYDCAINTLGPVYPGQILQVDVFTPCSENTPVIYAETHNNLLPSIACKIAHQTELLNTINNYSGILNYTIVSDNTDMCELFLTISPHLYHVYEAFYVKLLPCPVGFTLQNGICDCDPLLPPDIDTCYIEQSVIRRPVTMWITAHVQSNDTKYLTGNCPMDYCLPYSSNILLTNPDTQCQFNRTGVLCSQCPHPLSMVFGSSRCMNCTNLHVLIAILIILAGILLVTLMYLLNLTVTNETINGIIFYANIISINDSVFLIDNVYKPLRVFVSFANLDLGIETCFYNRMDSYAKIWLQLFFPSYLIIIAISIIIASRYSPILLRLTYTRSLPVLATLFLLSYTGILRVVLTVLFSYSTITHLPSNHQQLVWSIDASVPLFGIKFTVLFVTCLILFLLLIPFNIILLFRRYLSWFRFINHFKPILDAFQGSYKDKYYYWVGVHITLRSIFYALYAFQPNLRLMLAVIILIFFVCYFGYIQPYKNKAVNIQELLLLVNLTILHAVSYHNNKIAFFIISNVMISLAFIQFCTIMLCHFLIYTCHCNVVIILVILKEKLMKLCSLRKPDDQHTIDISLLNIPERTYNYSEYRDGLVSDDFK